MQLLINTSVYIPEEVNNYTLYYTIVQHNADTMHIHTKSNSRQTESEWKQERGSRREGEN